MRTRILPRIHTRNVISSINTVPDKWNKKLCSYKRTKATTLTHTHTQWEADDGERMAIMWWRRCKWWRCQTKRIHSAAWKLYFIFIFMFVFGLWFITFYVVRVLYDVALIKLYSRLCKTNRNKMCQQTHKFASILYQNWVSLLKHFPIACMLAATHITQ